MSKLKEYFSKHKKSCVLAIMVVIGAVVYCTTGQDMDITALADKLCAIIGC